MTEHEYACEKLAEQRREISHLHRQIDWLIDKLQQIDSVLHGSNMEINWREIAKWKTRKDDANV